MDINETYDLAQVALQAGQVAECRHLLTRMLQANPRHEQAWLALAEILTDPDQKQDCLERVVAINPQNEQALSLLDAIRSEKVRLEVLAMLVGPVPVGEKESVSRLGKYLLEARFITPDQLDLALVEQQKAAGRQENKKLGEILVEQGVLTGQQLEQAIRNQYRDFNNLFVD